MLAPRRVALAIVLVLAACAAQSAHGTGVDCKKYPKTCQKQQGNFKPNDVRPYTLNTNA
jgi:hypothetical protein